MAQNQRIKSMCDATSSIEKIESYAVIVFTSFWFIFNVLLFLTIFQSECCIETDCTATIIWTLALVHTQTAHKQHVHKVQNERTNNAEVNTYERELKNRMKKKNFETKFMCASDEDRDV